MAEEEDYPAPYSIPDLDDLDEDKNAEYRAELIEEVQEEVNSYIDRALNPWDFFNPEPEDLGARPSFKYASSKLEAALNDPVRFIHDLEIGKLELDRSFSKRSRQLNMLSKYGISQDEAATMVDKALEKHGLSREDAFSVLEGHKETAAKYG